MGEGSIADWSAIYLKESLHSTVALAGLGYGGFSVMMAIGRLNGDTWIPKIGAKKIVIAGSLTAAAGFLLVIAFPYKATAIAGFSLVGIGYACIVPILFSAAANVPGISPAMGISAIASGGLIGFLFGPSVIGMVAEQINLAAGLSFILILNIIAAYCCYPQQIPGYRYQYCLYRPYLKLAIIVFAVLSAIRGCSLSLLPGSKSLYQLFNIKKRKLWP